MKTGWGNPQEQNLGIYARLSGVFAIWAVVLGCIAIVAAIRIGMQNAVFFPFEDQWAILSELWSHGGTYSFPTLWAQHNEHRLPFGKLLLMADLYWFRGRNVSLFVENYLIQFLHLGAFILALRYLTAWPKWLQLLGSGLAAFSLFWVSQYQSFLNPFGVSALPAYLFGTVAVISIVLVSNAGSRTSPWFFVALLAAFLSEMSLACGLLIWPLLAVLAWRLRLERRLLLILAGVGALLTALYFAGYVTPPGHAKPLVSLGDPVHVLHYVLIYFGSVWSGVSTGSGELLALGAIFAAGFAYVRELRKPEAARFSLIMLSLCLFLAGTGFLTALGRINFGPIQATASMYKTTALLFWLCFSLFSLDFAQRLGLRVLVRTAGVILLLATAMFAGYSASVKEAAGMKKNLETYAFPIYSDVKDDSYISRLQVLPDTVFALRPFLKEHKAAFYNDPRYLLLGKSLRAEFPVAPFNRCFGALGGARKVADPNFPGWEMIGWGWDHEGRRPIESIVAVTDHNTITGLGEVGYPRPDVPKVHSEVIDIHTGWRVYVKGATDFPNVELYGLVDHGKAVCLVTPGFPVH